MPHYRTQLDPVQIAITTAALGPDVWPSLKMARAALDGAVAAEIDRTLADLNKGVEALKLAAAERTRDLRAQRKIALKVRESELPSDEPAAAQAQGEAA